MSKMKKLFLYSICAVLIIFYLYVLYLGQHPRVGLEYRMYYITHELSDWPGYGRLAYNLDTEQICTGLMRPDNSYVDYTVCQTKGQGWERNQYTGSVNNNTTSTIYYIPTTTDEKAVFAFNIKEYSGSGEVDVMIGDQKIGIFNGTGNFAFDTAGAVKEGEMIKISFVARNCSFKLWSVCLKSGKQVK